MPVKWTAENDHLLLLTLLETHNIKVDGEKIRSAWPKVGGEQPTARAIRERIVKIRSLAGSPSKTAIPSHINNGIVKKETSPHKRTPGKRRQMRTSVDRDDEEIIAQSFTSPQGAERSPCPSPRKKRATAKVKVEQNPSEPEVPEVFNLTYSESSDEFMPKEEMDDDDDEEYRGD